MNTVDIVQKLWSFCDILRDDGISYHQYVTELTLLLFLKITKETGSEKKIPPEYRWDELTSKDGMKQYTFYRDLINKLGQADDPQVAAIYAGANTSVKDPKHLNLLVKNIDSLDWQSAKREKDGLGDLYEGLLEKSSSEINSGAGLSITIRALIDSMVRLVQPKAGEIMQDPAAGTAGFIIAVDKYIKEHTTEQNGIGKNFQFRQNFTGMERIRAIQIIGLMNCMLHGIEIDAESPILLGDTLGNEGLKLPKSDIIITNPPFGGKKNGEPPLRNFPYPTSNQTLLFLQHVYLSLNPGGRAAVVVPDNVLFEEGIGQKVRVDLMEKCELHTILRLPTGIFNLRGVKTNVLFFTKGITETGNTKDVWVYDLRTNMPPFGKVIPFTREHLTEFEKAYGDDPWGKSKRKDEGDSGRFRRFSRSEIREEKKENLDILWLDSNEQDGVEKEATDSDINKLMDKPFDPTKINIETKTPSLDTLIKRIQRKTVQLNTESYFQRKDDLWDKRKQSRLIESILIQFPLPAFFFDATDDNNWLVVDGLQRLSSIRNFAVNKTLKLTNLEFLTHLNGKGWDELGDLQRIIEESQVVIYKIMPGTPTDVKFNIFKRINTGGLVLESQEIRHALFQGKPAEFIAELAMTEEFIDATAGKIKTHRMLDRDFANRFLCFYLFGYKQNYGSKEYGFDLDTYMSKAMASIYSKTEAELDIIREDFKESMKLAKDIFGKKAFRKVYEDDQRLPPINKALFDAISVQFALLTLDERKALREKKDEFEKSLQKFLNEDELFFMSVTSSTSDKNRVYTRHHSIKELIKNTIQG